MNYHYNKKSLEKFLFFVIMRLWLILMIYTIIPSLIGVGIPVHKGLEIAYLTVAFVIVAFLNYSVNLFAFLTYPFVLRKSRSYHRRLIQNSKMLNRQQKEMPLVSIIIPSRNEENVIRETILDSLKQTYQKFEIIVVCHNSSDKTYERAQIRDGRVKVFDLKTSDAGKGIAVNFGIDRAKGDYICILDADGKLSRDFIETVLPFFNEGYAGVQGRITASNREYNTITRLLALEDDLYSVPLMSVRSFLDRRAFLGGTGLVLRKDTLVSLGKFSNELIDDFELTFRLFRNKYKIAFAPLSKVYDEKPPTLDILFRQRSRWVKGHIDLLKHRIAQPEDIIGHLCWISPISTIFALMIFLVSTSAILHALIFGYSPYEYAYIPIKISLSLMLMTYCLYIFIIIAGEHEYRNLRNIVHAGLLIPFSYYWYISLFKAFFVKSWSNTKTPHGLGKISLQKIAEECDVIEVSANEDHREA